MTTITKDNQEVQRRICKALDLDPVAVRSLEIKLEPHEAVLVEAVLYVQENQFETLCLELEQCSFVEKK